MASPYGLGYASPSVRPVPIQLSQYLLLNYWAEINQTCYMVSLHSKGVREQHHFFVCPSICSSITLSRPKLPGGI